jgi:paraquat-inducible protein B
MDDTRQTILGLFVVGAVCLALGTIVFFGRFDPFRRSQVAEVVFERSVSGLDVGSPVTFRGVRVGSVSSISIEHDPRTNRTFIPVKLRLNSGKVVFPRGVAAVRPSVAEMVASGLRADLIPVSLISGESEIDLDFVPSNAARLHPAISEMPEIPVNGSRSGSVAQQLSELPLRDLVNNAGVTLQSIRRLSETLSAGIPQFIDSTTRTSMKATETLEAARVAIKEAQTRLGVTMAGIDRLTASADQQINGRGADLHTLLVSANGAIIQTRTVLTDLETLTGPRTPAHANLEASLNDLSAASASLRALATDLEQNPRLLLTGRRQ